MDIANAVITIGACVTAVGGLIGIMFALFRWLERQKSQDTEIARIKEEQTVLCYGVLACLDGLAQLGCNHSVPDAKDKLEKHLNKEAHR